MNRREMWVLYSENKKKFISEKPNADYTHFREVLPTDPDIDEFKEVFMGLLYQDCGEYNESEERNEFHHRYIGFYYEAINFALKMGWITVEQVRR
jgi:hypothetical protein